MVAVATGGGYNGAQYGAIELKSVRQRYWTIALGIAIVIHLAIVGSYYLVETLRADEPPIIRVRIISDIQDLGPPPSITKTNMPPPLPAAAPKASPAKGVPVPVPDVNVNAEQTLASQSEMNEQVGEIGDGVGGGENVLEPGIENHEDVPPEIFVPVEMDPVVVKRVEPKFPQLAMRAGLEGRVLVNIWVDKEGKVRQVVVLKSDAEIFNEAAIEAAKQFVFTPAYMNNGPVSVWVQMSFKFKLADKK